MTLAAWLGIALGSGAGAASRAALVFQWRERRGMPMWLVLLLLNMTGSLLAGVLVAQLDRHQATHAALVTGFLGGFTTFSGFAVECIELWQRGRRGVALAFAAACPLLCVLSAMAGFHLLMREAA
ncbi:MAG: crcB-like protein [Planctomycetota bacterium]|jgi:CrcB protein